MTDDDLWLVWHSCQICLIFSPITAVLVSLASPLLSTFVPFFTIKSGMSSVNTHFAKENPMGLDTQTHTCTFTQRSTGSWLIQVYHTAFKHSSHWLEDWLDIFACYTCLVLHTWQLLCFLVLHITDTQQSVMFISICLSLLFFFHNSVTLQSLMSFAKLFLGGASFQHLKCEDRVLFLL